MGAMIDSSDVVSYRSVGAAEETECSLADLVGADRIAGRCVALVATPRFWRALVVSSGVFVGHDGPVDTADAFDVRFLVPGGEIRWLASPGAGVPLRGRAVEVSIGETADSAGDRYRTLDRHYRCWGTTSGALETAPGGFDLGPFAFHETESERVGSLWLPIASTRSMRSTSVTLDAKEIVRIDRSSGIAAVVDEVAIGFSFGAVKVEDGHV